MNNGVKIILAIVVLALAAYFLFFFEKPPPLIEVKYEGEKTIVQSENLGMQMWPSNGEIIKGLMSIRVDKVPENTAQVWLGMVRRGQYNDGLAPNLGFDPDGGNGWSLDFHTKDIVNGEYTVFVVPKNSAGNEITRLHVNVTVQN